MEPRRPDPVPQRGRLHRAVTSPRTLVVVAFTAGLSAGVAAMLSLIPSPPVPAWSSPAFTPRLTDDVDVDVLVRARDTAAVRQTRKALIRFAWGPSGFPRDALPADAERVSSPFDSISSQVRRLSVVMDSGFTSELLHVEPIEPTGRAVIYHRGHEPDSSGTQTIARFVDAGFDVVSLSMPLFEPNPQPTLSLQHFGPLMVEAHVHLQFVPLATGSWLQFFLHPVAVAVNYLEARGLTDIAMVGLSGGGWTTTVAAAVDPRIRRSYPVAGSHPLFLRRGTHLGDFEQTAVELLRIANYLDFYVMGSVGEGRSQLQVLNLYDSCCFSGLRHQHYEGTISRLAAAMGGVFSVLLDESHAGHMVSDLAIAAILSDLESSVP